MNWDTTDNQIYRALVALIDRCDTGSCVIIEDSDSGKFVQFGRGPKLEIDVPCLSLTGVEFENASQFFESLGEQYYPQRQYRKDGVTGKILPCLTFTHDFGQDARAAAEAAKDILLGHLRAVRRRA